jgi:hypothetical protein
MNRFNNTLLRTAIISSATLFTHISIQTLQSNATIVITLNQSTEDINTYAQQYIEKIKAKLKKYNITRKKAAIAAVGLITFTGAVGYTIHTYVKPCPFFNKSSKSSCMKQNETNIIKEVNAINHNPSEPAAISTKTNAQNGINTNVESHGTENGIKTNVESHGTETGKKIINQTRQYLQDDSLGQVTEVMLKQNQQNSSSIKKIKPTPHLKSQDPHPPKEESPGEKLRNIRIIR